VRAWYTLALEKDIPMTRIVDEHFPVADLPERIRLALGNATHVKLTIEDRAADEALRRDFMEAVSKGFEAIEAGRFFTVDQVRARMKARFNERDAAE
jgi:predicted transcriptional regulator